MLRSFFCVVLAFAQTSQQGAAATHARDTQPTVYVIAARPLRVQAPADEYFGHYELSTLSIRTAIDAMTIEGNSPLALPLQTERIAAVESALGEWADHYPYDPWLPNAMAKFATFLIGKQRPEYDRAALGLLENLEWKYPNTWYAHFAADKLATLDVHPQSDLLLGPMSTQLKDVNESYLHAAAVRVRH